MSNRRRSPASVRASRKTQVVQLTKRKRFHRRIIIACIVHHKIAELGSKAPVLYHFQNCILMTTRYIQGTRERALKKPPGSTSGDDDAQDLFRQLDLAVTAFPDESMTMRDSQIYETGQTHVPSGPTHTSDRVPVRCGAPTARNRVPRFGPALVYLQSGGLCKEDSD